jgi:hypothetical protein
MRLLAQLETRIQANLEAIAGSKEDHLLRVVVQFVKVRFEQLGVTERHDINSSPSHSCRTRRTLGVRSYI